MDASNMLKPALARGELHVIGATTLDEYRKHIEKDAALERRFQPVLVREPTRRGDGRDPARPAGPLRGPPPGPVHRRGARRGGRAVRPLHHRPVPARQGDRPDRPGRRPACGCAPRRSPADTKALEEEIERLERERDQAVAAEDYERADDAQDADRREPGASSPGSRQAAPARARGHGRRHRRGRLPGDRHPGRPAHRGGTRPAAQAGGAAARARRRPGRGGRRGRRGRPPRPGRPRRPEPADRQLPLPRPDRRRQDRAGAARSPRRCSATRT